MKQVKFLMLALVVLMGVGFTSCMNGENDTTVRAGGLVKVESSLGVTWFKDVNGVKLYPSATSMASMKAVSGFDPSAGDMAYIIYQYDSATQSSTDNLQLLYATELDATVESVQKPEEGGERPSNDSIAKAPIRNLKGTISLYGGGTIQYEPFMFDKSTLMLQIDYFMGTSGLLSHYFTLVHYTNEPVEENTIKLYLRHNNGNDTSTSYTSVNISSDYPFVFYKAFNLSKLDVHIDANTKIIIETQENSTKVDLEDSGTKTNTYEVLMPEK